MSERIPAPMILGGVAVVLLSGVAAYFGARMGRRDAPPEEPAEPVADVDSTTRDSIDRRLGYLEKRIDVLDDSVRTALELAKSKDERVAGAAAPPVREAGPDALKPRTGDPEGAAPAAVDPSDRDAVVARMTAAYKVTRRNHVVGQMASYADASREAAVNRNVQAMSDARELMAVLDLRGDEMREELVKIFKERLEAAARDIGPIVRDGLGRTDIATVRARLAALDTETDKKLRALFDETTWKRYEPNADAARQSTNAVLDEFEKARLGGR